MHWSNASREKSKRGTIVNIGCFLSIGSLIPFRSHCNIDTQSKLHVIYGGGERHHNLGQVLCIHENLTCVTGPSNSEKA